MSTAKINPFELQMALPSAWALNTKAAPGHELVDLRSLGLIPPIAGGARGYKAAADVMVGQTADGRDLNEIWNEFQETLRLVNEKRTAIVNTLTYPVSNMVETVPSFSGDDFEEASEYGVPKALRATGDSYQMGYTFKWYDVAARFTWQYLADASAVEVESVHNAVLDADSRNVFKEIMRTLFRNTNRLANIKGQNYNVYTFWNGDGMVPPPYKNNTFDGSHTHFRSSGAANLDSGDVEEMIADLKSHGYSSENGTDLALFVNEAQVDVIRTWRQGVTNANGAVAKWDFIPSQGQPAFIVPTQQGIIGGQPTSSYKGFNVVGSYGPALIIEESYIPAGYLVLVGSGGEGDLRNPIGFREHASASLKGLRLVQDKQSDYPLIDSYYVRGFGTGVRQRGGVAITRIGAAAYSVPPEYA